VLISLSVSLLLSIALGAPAISFGSTRFISLNEQHDTLTNTTATCTSQNMRIRKEWRRLSGNEKQAYIKAVQCLHEKPPKSAQYFPGAHSRYDDFVALHINATNGGIHNVGVFLPWHRLTVWNYETVLRNECGYTGAQPYWDYTLDTPERGGHFNSSPLFDPLTGFGGDGKAPPGKSTSKPACAFGSVCGNCVTDGPFAKYQIYLGPGNSFKANPRCLVRQVNGLAAETGAASKNIGALLNKSSFEQFQTLDGGASGKGFTPGVHSIGHLGVGGDMTNLWSSTNDPLFWLHHTELDRLWAIWQGDNATRLQDVAAPTTLSFGSLLGAKGKKTTLQTIIWQGQFPPDLAIGRIVDTQNKNGTGILCYRYEG